MENYRKLKPRLRRFAEAIASGKRSCDAALIVMPQSKSPKRLGWKLRNIPRVAAAIEELEAQAIEDAGITRVQVLLDAQAIKKRCMQAEQVLDRKGNPTGEYVFDSAGANKANEFLGKYLRIAPERHEVTGKDGGPIKSETNAPSLADFYNTVTRISLDPQPADPAPPATEDEDG